MTVTQLFPILLTRDLPRLVGFYEHALRAVVVLPVRRRGAKTTTCRCSIDAASLGIGRDASMPARVTGDRVALWFYVDDVDAVFHRWMQAGGDVAQEPQDMPWGERVAQVRDPDGNLVNLGRLRHRRSGRDHPVAGEAQCLLPVSSRMPPRPIMSPPPVAVSRSMRFGRLCRTSRVRSRRSAPTCRPRSSAITKKTRPELDHLQRDGPGVQVDELREHRDEERDRLGVRDADDEALAELAPRRARRRRRAVAACADSLRCRIACTPRYIEVERADHLDDREQHDRASRRCRRRRGRRATMTGSSPRALPSTLRRPPRRPSASARPIVNSTLGPGMTISTSAASVKARRFSIGTTSKR